MWPVLLHSASASLEILAALSSPGSSAVDSEAPRTCCAVSAAGSKGEKCRKGERRPAARRGAGDPAKCGEPRGSPSV